MSQGNVRVGSGAGLYDVETVASKDRTRKLSLRVRAEYLFSISV